MPSIGKPDPVDFGSPAALGAWFDSNAEFRSHLWVGFRKAVIPGRPVPLTWAQAVDEALCFGWIDGIRKSMPDGTYTIRFTPRRRGSVWSAVNVARVEALTTEGRMQPQGLLAFSRRMPDKTAIYSYEARESAAFDPAEEADFRADGIAWGYFESMPPSYRKAATYWVISARQRATRDRRMAQLVGDCAQGQKIAPLRRTEPSSTR